MVEVQMDSCLDSFWLPISVFVNAKQRVDTNIFKVSKMVYTSGFLPGRISPTLHAH